MKDDNKPTEIDWSSTTWEGSRVAQLRDWAKLPLLDKFNSIEELEAYGLAILQRRKKLGEPYFDPDTGEFVPGKKSITPAARVAEEPARYPDPNQTPQPPNL